MNKTRQLRIDGGAIAAAKSRFPEQKDRSDKDFIEWLLWLVASIGGVPVGYEGGNGIPQKAPAAAPSSEDEEDVLSIDWT